MRWAALYRPAQSFVVYLLHTTVRITPQTKRRNIVVDGIGGEVLSEALEALAFGRKPHALGYSGSRRRPSTSQVSSCHKPASGVAEHRGKLVLTCFSYFDLLSAHKYPFSSVGQRRQSSLRSCTPAVISTGGAQPQRTLRLNPEVVTEQESLIPNETERSQIFIRGRTPLLDDVVARLSVSGSEGVPRYPGSAPDATVL